MQDLYERVTTGERMEGVDRIYLPGEIEFINKEKRM